MADLIQFDSSEDTEQPSAPEIGTGDISTSIEDFTGLNSNLFGGPSWLMDPTSKDVFANPRLQHVHRRSISEPPMPQLETTSERPVVFHRQLHAPRKPRAKHRIQPYYAGVRQSPQLVNLGEADDVTVHKSTGAPWCNIQTPSTFVPIADPFYQQTPIDPNLLSPGQTLSITGKRTIEPVLRLTTQELREIIASTVRKTLKEMT